MKGIRQDVQNKTLEKYPRAFYLLCVYSNLSTQISNDTASFSAEITTIYFIA